MAQDAYNCNPTHSLADISLSSGVNGALLSVSATILNGSILYTLIKERNKRLQGMFQSPLLYTVTTDFFSGMITNMVFSVVHFVEWKHQISVWILRFQHVLIFVTTGLALVNVTFQGVDRVLAISRPLTHRIHGRRTWKWWLPLVFLWILSSTSVSLYFVVGFFSYLVTFTFINITMPILMMVLVLIVYILKRYDLRAVAAENAVRRTQIHEGESELTCGTTYEAERKGRAHKSVKPTAEGNKGDARCIKDDIQNTSNVKIEQSTRMVEITDQKDKISHDALESSQHGRQQEQFSSVESTQNPMLKRLNLKWSSTENTLDSENASMAKTNFSSKEETKKTDVSRSKGSVDKQIIRALILNLLLFILTYAPTVALIIYLNTCKNCNCYLVHVMRDATLQFILAGTLFRPIALLISAKSVRRYTRRALCKHR